MSETQNDPRLLNLILMRDGFHVDAKERMEAFAYALDALQPKPKCVICDKYPVFDAGDVCAPCAHQSALALTPGKRLALQLTADGDAPNYIGEVYDTPKGEVIVTARYVKSPLPLSDEECVAIFNGVKHAGITRDVKTAEQKCAIVRAVLMAVNHD